MSRKAATPPADDPTGPVRVEIGICRCPGTPHPDGDYVILRPADSIDLQMGLASRGALNRAGDRVGDTEAALYSVFVRHGVIAWNVLGDKGAPIPVTHDAIMARLKWATGGAEVALRAMVLYQDAVLDPLDRARSALQRPSPVNGSTSASPASGLSTPN